ncbi:hypothetical protein A2311_04625 [candidate division WOR-1 bacterium RIFOXYB2_FULL_48_7]|uniref:DUF4911 domain-containing protein n=1 Tax=candidate division WOR-1 bacterium RIFOXYB2_FULL_48_7 TaxID=1802583 RepID=A0A1F4TRS6_UNCSA|nr:MAG: hypothetical protein A2311_04625 [candidate division WOR-1 bacterium RIFOXYB2_FULL_48_7]
MKDTINFFLRVRKEDIYLLCPYFESFEGLAAIRTPKPAPGEFAILKLMVAPDFQAAYEKLLVGLKGKIWYERVAGEN